MDFELFHRKQELAAHLLQQELWAQVGTQAPDSQCAFKRTFESQAKPMRNVQIFHILGRQVVVQITAGMLHLGGLSCSWIAPMRVHDHMCTCSISSLAVGNQDIFRTPD